MTAVSFGRNSLSLNEIIVREDAQGEGSIKAVTVQVPQGFAMRDPDQMAEEFSKATKSTLRFVHAKPGQENSNLYVFEGALPRGEEGSYQEALQRFFEDRELADFV